jgi:hypothetical protein
MVPRTLKNIGQAISNLNPNEIRATAERPVAIGLIGASGESLAAMEGFLAPHDVSQRKRVEALRCIFRSGTPDAPDGFDIVLFEEGMPHPEGSVRFRFDEPERTVKEVLQESDALGLPLARRFPPFRREVTRQLVKRISKENALFALVTALPNMVPSAFELPWAVGEFASDAAFLTANQIRLTFLLAAASDHPIGYGEQKTEIASIIAGAFGWRAVARELAGKIPLGGGLIPKAAVAYAGTYVVGRSIERLYRLGYGFSRKERSSEYDKAYERGKQVASMLVESLRKKTPRFNSSTRSS